MSLVRNIVSRLTFGFIKPSSKGPSEKEVDAQAVENYGHRLAARPKYKRPKPKNKKEE